MDSIGIILRARWSHTWPGFALGVFSALCIILTLAVGAWIGRRMGPGQVWVYVPLYPIIPGLLLTAFLAPLPLLFARTRRKAVILAAARAMELVVAFAAFAFGFYGCVCAQFILSYRDTAWLLPLAGVAVLLAVFNAADFAISLIECADTPADIVRKAILGLLAFCCVSFGLFLYVFILYLDL